MERRPWTPPPWMIPLLVAALIVPTVIGFALAGPGLGLALGGLTLGALILVAARSMFREPIAPEPVAPGDPVLVVAVAPIASRAIASRIAALAAGDGEAPRMLVLAPLEPTAAQRWLSLRGTTREDAQRKLDEAVAALRAAGCEAAGEIVDEDPERAVADQAAVHGAAAIVFVVPTGDEIGGEIEDVRARTDRRVHVVEVAGVG